MVAGAGVPWGGCAWQHVLWTARGQIARNRHTNYLRSGMFSTTALFEWQHDKMEVDASLHREHATGKGAGGSPLSLF